MIKKIQLLTKEFGNPKLAKSSIDSDYVVCGLHLAPYTSSGYNVCPAASLGCQIACLNFAGNGKYKMVQRARIARTELYFENRALFKKQLIEELHYFCGRCFRNGWKPACRLNLTSDIVWEKVFPELFQEFPTVQFYDYTKIQKRVLKGWQLPPNYHLTFSRSESNDEFCKQLVKQKSPKINIAVVFNKQPQKFLKRQVISGDYSDLRFLDPQGVIIALTEKGRAFRDLSGFVVRS